MTETEGQTERKRALESMRGRLQAEERSRQAFLGTASHELRTPLALLQATVELMDEALAAPVPDIDNARRGAATAGRQTRRLAAERRRELDPLRQKVRSAEETVARLTREREALDRALVKQQGNGISPAEALKRRAEIVRLIERAETDWLAAAEAIEREARA